MEGIGLENMLDAKQVEALFSNPATTTEESVSEEVDNNNSNNESLETTEVDFSDLLGNQPESVGSGEESEGERGTSTSDDAGGSPLNLFPSLARALKDEGVFPDLSDEVINSIKDAADLKKMFDDEVSRSLNERQKRIENALNSGANNEELQQYQVALNLNDYLSQRDTQNLLIKEGNDGDEFRRRIMYQDYVNRGFNHDRAVKLVEKSFSDGTELADAKEAFNSCKEYYSKQVEDYQNTLNERENQKKAAEEQQYAALKKRILDTDNFFGGVQVDKALRQKAYDSLTKPVYKDADGNYLTALQQYQREHPAEFMEHVAMLYSLTDGFKNVDNLTKKPIKAGIKKGFDEVANILNSTRRNGDGSLNLSNTSPDDLDRENWTLAI